MKRIGKIESIDLSVGGYQDAAFGLSIKFKGEDWSGHYFDGPWGVGIKHREDRWTEQDRTNHFGKILRRINLLCTEAKVDCFRDLNGAPVEVELIGYRVEGFRILTEVL